jgi:hypothetical protein
LNQIMTIPVPSKCSSANAVHISKITVNMKYGKILFAYFVRSLISQIEVTLDGLMKEVFDDAIIVECDELT